MAILIKSRTKESIKDNWRTSDAAFELARRLYGVPFEQDVCSEDGGAARCERFITPEMDALKIPWLNNWWCNPPFSRKPEFIAKAVEQAQYGRSGMMLLPYTATTKWFRLLVMDNAAAVFVPNRRFHFHHPDGGELKSGSSFESCLVLFNPHFNGGEARIIHVEF